MVLIVKGGGSRALAHKVFGEPGNPVFLLEERKVPPIAHGTGGQNIADRSVPHILLHYVCHVLRTAAQRKAVAVLQFEPDIAVILPHELLQHLDDPFAVHFVCSAMRLSTGFNHGNRFCQSEDEGDACIGNRDSKGALIIEFIVRDQFAKHGEELLVCFPRFIQEVIIRIIFDSFGFEVSD